MSWVRKVVELPPSLRWRRGQLLSMALYRRAFGSFGRGSVIVRPLILRGVERIHLGAGCAVFEDVWLACEPGRGAIRIGDETYLGHGVHVHADDEIRIGRECVLADGVFISSTDHVRGAPASGSVATGTIQIGDRVFIGQRAVVLGGVTIGDGATVAASAVVTHDVPPGAVVAGVPARVLQEGKSA